MSADEFYAVVGPWVSSDLTWSSSSHFSSRHHVSLWPQSNHTAFAPIPHCRFLSGHPLCFFWSPTPSASQNARPRAFDFTPASQGQGSVLCASAAGGRVCAGIIYRYAGRWPHKAQTYQRHPRIPDRGSYMCFFTCGSCSHFVDSPLRPNLADPPCMRML